ncbi:unnamed protein product [Protopolystoma xenopodis]|uniref:Uncharacterized protein n=1 Tax=Protopolystoma xenopodis TaxID=117903 RepID=A0A3S5C4P9_9PLAT|nr:unnamed protein product [Protopolystoma xenopodis]
MIHDERTGLEGDCLGNSVNKNVPVKPIDNWSRGIGRRLLVELTFQSLHQTCVVTGFRLALKTMMRRV